MTTEEKNDIRARSTSIDDVLHDLQEKVDVVAVDKKNVVIGDDGRLLINGIELTDIAHSQLTSIIKYPYSFCKKVEGVSLINDIKNYCIDRCETKEIKILNSMNEIYTVVDSKFPVVTQGQLLTQAKSVDAAIRVQFQDNDCINLVTQLASNPPRDVNDVSHGGMNVLFNSHGLSVSSFIYRLVCTNGMILPRNLSTKYLEGETDKELLDKFRSMIIDTIEITKNMFMPTFIKTSGIEIKDPAEFITNLGRAYKMPGGEIKKITDKIPSLPAPTTAYDIINLITQMGTEVFLDNHKKGLKLQAFGGYLSTSFNEKHCVKCGQLV